MKEFIYSDADISRLKGLLNQRFNYLVCNIMNTIVSFSDSSFVIQCTPARPATPNPGWDEVIYGKLIWDDLSACHKYEDDFVIRDSSIESITIVRGGLSFTKFATWEAKGDFNPINMTSGSSGGNEELMLDPESRAFNDIPSDFKNLVDYGLILKVNERNLMCFIVANSYGFHGTMDYYFLDEPLLARLIAKHSYQLIEVK